jgi:hypothetical protein
MLPIASTVLQTLPVSIQNSSTVHLYITMPANQAVKKGALPVFLLTRLFARRVQQVLSHLEQKAAQDPFLQRKIRKGFRASVQLVPATAVRRFARTNSSKTRLRGLATSRRRPTGLL